MLPRWDDVEGAPGKKSSRSEKRTDWDYSGLLVDKQEPTLLVNFLVAVCFLLINQVEEKTTEEKKLQKRVRKRLQ